MSLLNYVWGIRKQIWNFSRDKWHWQELSRKMMKSYKWIGFDSIACIEFFEIQPKQNESNFHSGKNWRSKTFRWEKHRHQGCNTLNAEKNIQKNRNRKIAEESKRQKLQRYWWIWTLNNLQFCDALGIDNIKTRWMVTILTKRKTKYKLMWKISEYLNLSTKIFESKLRLLISNVAILREFSYVKLGRVWSTNVQLCWVSSKTAMHEVHPIWTGEFSEYRVPLIRKIVLIPLIDFF